MTPYRDREVLLDILPAVLTVLIVLVTGSARAEDWPRWTGPHGDFSSADKGWRKDWPEKGPPVLFQTAAGEGYSSVVVSEGTLILFHRIGDELHVDALDALSGKRRWRSSYPTDYVDRYGYSGGPRCCPIVDTGAKPRRVYTLGPRGTLQCLDVTTGRRVWSRELKKELKLPRNFFGVGAAPLLLGERLYLNLGGTDLGTGKVIALDKLTGKLAWQAPSMGGSYASPVFAAVHGLQHLFVFHRGGLSSYNPETGKERWTFRWHSRIYDSVNAALPIVAGDIVFFSAAYRTGSVALRLRDTASHRPTGGSKEPGKKPYEVLWQDKIPSRVKILETHWSTSHHVAGHLYGFSGRHENPSSLRCVELETGKVLWKWDNEESNLGRAAMIRSDGHFIALGERGDVVLLQLSPEGHKELRRVRRVLKWPAWCVPTLANGLLYLRDEEKLVCWDLRSGPK